MHVQAKHSQTLPQIRRISWCPQLIYKLQNSLYVRINLEDLQRERTLQVLECCIFLRLWGSPDGRVWALSKTRLDVLEAHDSSFGVNAKSFED